MYSKVKNYDSSHPTYKKNKHSYRWSWLFMYDQFIGRSASVKNKDGKVLKKLENNTKTAKSYRKLHDSNVDQLLKDNQHFASESPLPLPEIAATDFNKELFRPWKKNINTPLVVRGYLKDAPILDLMSFENLTTTYGETKIKCALDVQDEETESRTGQNLKTASTTLKEFLQSEAFLNYYINNFFGVLSNDDFLRHCHGQQIEEIAGKKNVLTQWFISRTLNSGSTLHCAPADNIFLNIKGRKEWHFIHPSYTPIMQPTLSKYGVYAVSELNETMEGNFFDNITEAYPFMKNVPISRVVLEEGDVLFNPPWWWHSVRNLEEFTVGCATRYWSVKKSTSNAPTLVAGAHIESMKHPRKSVINLALASLRDKKNASKYMDSIFSGR